MARNHRSDRGGSRRPTRTGTAAGRGAAGSRRSTRGGRTAQRRPATTRGRGVGGRPTTRTGVAVPPAASHSGLLIGGLVLGVVAVVVLIGVMASSGDKERRPAPEPKTSMSVADTTPHGSAAPARPQPPREADRQPLDAKIAKPRKPASYYRELVDMKLWEEAKGYARQADALLARIDRRDLPAGMTKDEARKKAKDLLHQAVAKGAEFMAPLDNQREEAEHFIVLYEDEMMRWQRKTRSLLFGSKN